MTLRQKTYATEGDASFALAALLTLVADNVTLRATDWSESLVSDGKTYLAQPFKTILAAAGDDAPPRASVRIDNVNLMFMTAIRSVSDILTAMLAIVTPSTPNTIELGPFDFDCRLGKYDGTSVELDLSYEPILDLAVPHHVFSPAIFPGLFR